MIDNSKLKDHTKKGDTLYTPLNAALGDTMQLSSWGRDHLPEYIWIASIIDGLGRDEGLKRLYQEVQGAHQCGSCPEDPGCGPLWPGGIYKTFFSSDYFRY